MVQACFEKRHGNARILFAWQNFDFKMENQQTTFSSCFAVLFFDKKKKKKKKTLYNLVKNYPTRVVKKLSTPVLKFYFLMRISNHSWD